MCHQLNKDLEKVQGVVRAGRGFRVVLDAEDGFGFVAQPLDAVVVQVEVAHFNLIGQRAGRYGKAVVVAGDGDITLL